MAVISVVRFNSLELAIMVDDEVGIICAQVDPSSVA